MAYSKDAPAKEGPFRDPHARDARGDGKFAARDAKNAASPNIQDVFLNYARREKLVVAIRLLDGQTLEGRIKNFDRFAVIVDHAGADHMVFKHAIATIKSPRTIGSYYASHEPAHPSPAHPSPERAGPERSAPERPSPERPSPERAGAAPAAVEPRPSRP
jgi:host factor-I protein